MITTRLKVGIALAAVGLLGAAAPAVVSIPVALTNAALSKYPASTFLNMPMARMGFTAVGDAPVSWWWTQTGTCASHGMTSNGASCQDASDGNSFAMRAVGGATLQANFLYSGSTGLAIPSCAAVVGVAWALVTDGKASPTTGTVYAAADGAAKQPVYCIGGNASWFYLQ